MTCSTGSWTLIRDAGAGETDEEPEDTVRLAVIGRPNVGKSSLVNAFLGAGAGDRGRAGRHDARRDRHPPRGGRPARSSWSTRPGCGAASKVAGTVDYYAQLRSERAAERADVALVVCDASEGVTSEDLRIADLAMRKRLRDADRARTSGTSTQTDLEDAKDRVAAKLRLRPRVMTASATTGRNVTRLMVEAVALADRARGRIPTAELNRFVSEVQSQRQPPAVRGKRLRIYYAAQVETGPPRFRVHVNDRRLVVRDYAYFVENRLRERYRLEGVPLVIDFADRERRASAPALGARDGRDGRRAQHERAARPALGRVLALVVAALAVLAVAAAGRRRSSRVATTTAGAATRPSSWCPPRALLYVHASVDEGSDQWTRRASASSRGSRACDGCSRSSWHAWGGREPGRAADRIRPWLGDEAALALLPGGAQRDLADPARASATAAGAQRS